MWRNWAGDQQCVPARTERPRTLEELRRAVARAADAGLTVRAAGSGHSFTDIACTDGLMLRIEGLSRVLDADQGSGLVKVEAGIVLRDLSEALWHRGLALPSLGDIDVQTLAGAISTATHGTGPRFGNVSAQVEGVELVLADGTVLEVTKESDPETLRAARVSLGSLGVLATVTLRTVPAFVLRRHDYTAPLEETLGNLDELIVRNRHFELYAFPHTDVAMCRETTEHDGAPPRERPLAEWAQDVLLENHAFGTFMRVARRFPSRIPQISRLVTRAAGSSVKVAPSYKVFSTRRQVRFTEMEYAVSRADGPEALRRVLEMIERRGYAVPFPIEMRFVGPDDAHLSTAHGYDTCYIAVHMFNGMIWEPYFRAVEAIMDSYGGRPHWGKRHFQSAATLAPRYPDWDKFQETRSRLDPGGVFSNEYSQRVLGPLQEAASLAAVGR
jgi:L-gulonolactone oxidase